MPLSSISSIDGQCVRNVTYFFGQLGWNQRKIKFVLGIKQNIWHYEVNKIKLRHTMEFNFQLVHLTWWHVMAEPKELFHLYLHVTIFNLVQCMNYLKFNPNVTQTIKQQQNPIKQKLPQIRWVQCGDFWSGVCSFCRAFAWETSESFFPPGSLNTRWMICRPWSDTVD